MAYQLSAPPHKTMLLSGVRQVCSLSPRIINYKGMLTCPGGAVGEAAAGCSSGLLLEMLMRRSRQIFP